MHGVHKHLAHVLKWALIHAALVCFMCDLLAAVWPAFHRLFWNENIAHLGVAFAAFAATLAEYIHDDKP